MSFAAILMLAVSEAENVSLPLAMLLVFSQRNVAVFLGWIGIAFGIEHP